MNDIYAIMPENECFSKRYGDYLEMYNSHINVCISFIKPVINILKFRYEYNYVKNMVLFHDIGKRGREFQESIKSRKRQYIRHEELAFIMWLDNYPDLMCLDKPQILAILAHHRTLIDEKSAIEIERYISEHENMKELSRKWLDILKTPRKNRIDNRLLLPALRLVDILRTIDILSSYTTETILYFYLNCNYAKSIYDSAYTDLSRELSNINLRADKIKFETTNIDEKKIKIQILEPINSIVEYIREESE